MPYDLIRSLSRSWQGYEGGEPCRPIGDAWLEAAKTPLLLVPSAIVPEEQNMILNPVHARFGAMRIVEMRRFRFNKRLVE
ncbi:MAG: RES family NAD+ phosphorylase [Gemmatimonadales bacterium]|nr:RES family NAD+ phosphorylase [Gemmatimonadales bacterium]